MAFKNRAEPTGGREVVGDALGRRRHQAHSMPSLRGAPRIGAPLPVFLIHRRDAKRRAPMSAARLVGWRYPIVGAEEVALASLREGEHGKVFTGIEHGLLPERLMDAAKLADSKLKGRPSHFEPRLLEVPSLRIHVLWLYRARQSRFVSLMEGRPPGTGELTFVRSIAPLIHEALEASRHRRRHPKAASIE